jgi:predicted MPP superfamily phosphohydrolase
MALNFTRRKFLKGSLILGGAGLLTGLYAWQIEPFWLEFVERKLPIRNLPTAVKGKRLMQISDLHVGNRFNRQYLIDSFVEAKAYNPDIVVYTGDFINYESAEQFDQLNEVFAHAVIGKMATIGILGNHDYGVNWEQQEVANRVTEIVTSHGITVLRNQKTEVNGLTIIGLDDLWSPNFQPELAFIDTNFNQANLVLCHNPDAADLPIWQGYQDWILAGHTHGGQCKPPFLNPPMLPVKNKRYTAGEFSLSDGKKMYINRALGHLWQIRFNVRPEITIFELV